MKVKSGKLQVGDVKVWKDGEKDVFETQDEVNAENSLMSSMHVPPQPYFDNEDTIGWLLSEPTAVKCIKRKKTKEIELGPDDVMEKGDIVRYNDGAPELIVKEGFAGKIASYVVGYPNDCKVYRPIVKSPKNPWKKTGKMLDEMIEKKLMPDISTNKNNTNVRLYMFPDKTLFFYNSDVHIAVKQAYDAAKESGWL